MLYEYNPDTNHYAAVGQPEGLDVASIYYTDEPQSAHWVPREFYVYDDNPPQIGDFPTMNSYGKLPLLSPRAWEVLEPLIGACCEPLPIIWPGQGTYYIIHVMKTIDALDLERSEVKRFQDGGIMRIVRFAFKRGLLEGQHIFKLPRECARGMFVDQVFRDTVERHGLQGLQFKPLPMAD